eukprot:1180044-Prorocentrum_minimum.AAC.1
MEGAKVFTIQDFVVRLPPKSAAEFEVKCCPNTSKPTAACIIFSSRKDDGASAATLVFGLVCKTDSRRPIKTQ